MNSLLFKRFIESRDKILHQIGEVDSVTFVRGYGNIGDDLIYAGARQLLSGLEYNEIGLTEVPESSGELALLAGSGAFCGTYPQMVKYLPIIERQFKRVLILPSSFDPNVPAVRAALEKTRAFVFVREMKSYEAIRGLCAAELAHDCAFYFDFSPFSRKGRGTLHAFRTDKEANGGEVPPDNNDISASCETLDQWLWTIARHELIRTDRAHVMIAGAMMGKRVEFGTSNYHKVPAIAEFSLHGFPVTRIPGSGLNSKDGERCSIKGQKSPVSNANRDMATDRQQLTAAAQEIADLWSPGEQFLLVDDGQVLNWPLVHGNAIPFLERNGQFWGPPADDTTAIDELRRMRVKGASFIAFSWHAFWWLEHYKEFFSHLKSRYHCALQNERLVVFDLRAQISD